MEYKISISEDGKYIIVKVTGIITTKAAMKPLIESHALGRQLGINRYLTDVTEAKNEEKHSNNYEFAYTDMQNADGMNKNARTAAVVSPDDHSHDFLETVSMNSGFDFRIFRDRAEAIKYLMEE